MMQALSGMLPNKERLMENKDTILKDIEEFYKQYYEDFEGRNNNKSDIERRIELLKTFFEKYI